MVPGRQYPAQDPAGRPGRRIPAIFQRAFTNILHICSYIDGYGNECFDTEDFATRDTPVSVTVSQSADATGTYHYEILIDDIQVYHNINTTPTTWYNVEAQFGPAAATTSDQAQAYGSYSDLYFISKRTLNCKCN